MINPNKHTAIVSADPHHGIHNISVEILNIVYEFKVSIENGSLNFVNLFTQLNDNLSPVTNKDQRSNIQQFTNFFTSLLNNTLLSIPIKFQLSRLSSPLVELALIDPKFYKDSSHQIVKLLQSIIDFELQFQHNSEGISILTESITELLQINNPTINDYQSLISNYEHFKEAELKHCKKIKKERLHQEKVLKAEIVKLIKNITNKLTVCNDTKHFFYSDWQFLLLHLAQTSGKDSKQFNDSVTTAKVLSWFLDQNKAGSHPKFKQISFKDVLKSVQASLASINFSSEHRHRIHQHLLNEYKQAHEEQSFNSTSTKSASTTKVIREARYNHETKSANEALKFAIDLKIGQWVEIKSPPKKQFSRAKLKFKSADNSLFRFIDQRGQKVKECSLDELQQGFSNGSIKILKKPAHQKTVYH